MKRQIMVVDDDPAIRELFHEALDDAGYDEFFQTDSPAYDLQVGG